MSAQGRWIPPQGLLFGQLAHGASWLALFVLALHGRATLSLPGLAWVHLVALGWLTMVALSVLIHVVPAFTDVTWRWERLARRSLVVYPAGVIALVCGFAWQAIALLPLAGGTVVIGLTGYAIPAAATLMRAMRTGGTEAAIARALAWTLASLLLAAAFGEIVANALAGRLSIPLGIGATIHAEFGIIGWLTVLAIGVSTRTIRPITGRRSHHPWRHRIAGSALIAGMLILQVTAALRSTSWQWVGIAVTGTGIAVYATDTAAVLRHASVAHRPPQAFFGVAVFWLIGAFAFTIETVLGVIDGSVCVFLALAGWLGQLVNAHIYHIGVRLLSTMARGDDDETRPGVLLSPILSWVSFVLFQAAIAGGAVGLLVHAQALLADAALVGFTGWIAMTANLVHALHRAREPATIVLVASPANFR